MATADDYQLAHHLLTGPMGRLLAGRLSDGAMRYFERLTDWGQTEFTTTEATKRGSFSDHTVRGWLHELTSAGAVELLDPNRGPKPARWRATGELPEAGGHAGPVLPALEDVFGK